MGPFVHAFRPLVHLFYEHPLPLPPLLPRFPCLVCGAPGCSANTSVLRDDASLRQSLVTS